MFGESGRGERSGEIYLPYVGHISNHVISLLNGSAMTVGHVPGIAFELSEPGLHNARLRNLNTLYRNIADDNVVITTHLIRHPDVPELPPTRFRSEFAANLDRTYRDRVLDGQLFRNDYFVSLIVTPRNVLGKTGGRLARFRQKSAESVDRDLVRGLEDLWQVVANGLEIYGIRRLGLR